MSIYFKKANLALVLILIIGLCFPGNVSAAPGSSVAQTPSFGKSSPANSATVSPSGVKLQWQSISNIFQYRYCYYSYEITTNVCNIDSKSTWMSNGTSTSVTLPTLAGSKKYYWQVGAKLEDNTWVYSNGSLDSKWSFTTTAGGTTPVTPVDKFTYDDTDSKWTYTGTWTLYNGTGPYNNTVHYGTVGSDAQLTFEGTKFTLTYVKGSNRGLMDVYIDGVFQTTINAHASTLSWKQTWASPTLPAGSHTVRLVNAGGGTFVDVDAIEVSGVVPGGTYDDASINWVYTGTWSTYSGTGPYNNTLHYTGITGSGAEFSFSGTQFTVTYAKSNNRGLTDVTVDGVYVTTINTYSSTTLWKQTWTSPVYPSGVHTVRFEYAGSGSYIDVDSIKIIGDPPVVNPGIYDDANAAWIYTGSWTAYNGAGPYNNTVHYTSTAGNKAEIAFRGTKFNLIYTRASNRGSINIDVDGLPVATINANNSSTLWKQVWPSPTFPQGDHTITITHSGIGTSIDVDAVEVFGMVPVGIYDDNNSNWTYSGVWTASTVSGAYNSTLHKTNTIGSDAEITFDGARFILTYTKGSDRGSIDVYVDGVYEDTIDASNTSTLWQQTWTSSFYPAGQHTVNFVHAGVGTYIDIDKIQILGSPPTVPAGTYDDASTAWVYLNGWTAYSGTGPYNNTSHYTNVVGNIAQISFTGSQFTLTYVKASNRGAIDVFVDGFYEDTIDAHSATTLWKQTWTSPVYVSGDHTVQFVHSGAVGTYIDIDVIQIDNPFDPIPPAAITDLAAATGTTPGTVTLGWTAPSDDNAIGAAVSSYQVRYSTAAITNETEWGLATPVTSGIPSPRSAGHPETMTVTGLVPGTTYHFAVRAEDQGDSLAALSNDASAAAQNLLPLTAGTYDDPHNYLVYIGTWMTYSGSGPYNNTLHYTGTVGNAAEFSFDGIQFTLTYVKASTRGSIDVFIDGFYVNTINAYSATTKWKQTWTSPTLLPGVHTVRFEHAGGGTYIDVDAVKIVGAPPAVMPGTYDNTVSSWTYTGTWATYSGAGPYNNTSRYTNIVGNEAQIIFNGTQFNLIYVKAANRGSIDVYVDGGYVNTINANNATTLWQQSWTSPVFAAGVHTARFVHAGGGTYIDIDAIQILP